MSQGATAFEIGATFKRRAELGEAGALVESAHQARNQWIRTLNAVASILEMVGIDEQPILGRIREAERAAERRNATGGEDVPVVTPEPPTPDEPVPDEPTTDTPTPVEPS